MTNMIDKIADSKVLVAGDIMLDSYLFGETSRISPEAPVPVVHVQSKTNKAGGAGNVALNLAALDAEVDLIGVVGKDNAGKELEEILTNNGVKCHLISKDGYPTIEKTRILCKNQQLLRVDFEDDFECNISNELDIEFALHLSTCDSIIFSDYNKGSLKDIDKLIAIANKLNIPSLIDPKGQCYRKYSGATLITPNTKEFEDVVGKCSSEAMMVERGYNLVDDIDIDALLITRSEKGMLLLKKDAEPLFFPSIAREVYDVTGAGDTAIATIAAAIAAGFELEPAIRLANAAAGLVVAKLGAGTITRQELKNEADKANINYQIPYEPRTAKISNISTG